MALLEDYQHSFGGPRRARFPDWAEDTFPGNVNGGGHILTNVQIWDRGGRFFDVRAYGAELDDVTDDTQAFQDAIDDAKTVQGEVVFTRNALVTTLDIDAPITFSGIQSSVSGPYLRTISNAPIFNVTARCTIKDFALKGTWNAAFTSQELIKITDTSRVYLRNLFLDLGYHNIRYIGECFYCRLDGVHFNDSYNAHIRTTGSNAAGCELEIYNCTVTGGAFTSNYGFLFDNVGSLTISGLMFNHSKILVAGMKVNTVASLYGGILMGTSTIEIEGPPGIGPALWLEGTALAPVTTFTATGCQLGGSNVASQPIVTLGYVHNSAFIGCRVYGAAGANGIYFKNNVTGCHFIAVWYQGLGYQFIADTDTAVLDNLIFIGTTTDNVAQPAFYFHDSPPLTLGNISIVDCDLGDGDLTTSIDRPSFASGKIFRVSCRGYNQGPLTSPSIAATGVAVRNTFDVPVTVYVAGGTNLSVEINGATATGGSVWPNGTGTFKVPVSGQIALLYSGAAPTWAWFGE